MRELILKDLVLNKRFLVPFGGFFVLYMGYFGSRIERPGVFAVFSAFMFSFGGLALLLREDKFKAVGFSLSLPTTRREVLLEKYVLGWGMIIVLYVLAAGLAALLPGGKLGTAGFRPATILGAAAVASFAFGLMMPLTIRFGQAGILITLVVLQVLGIAALSLRALTDEVKGLVGAVRASIGAASAALGTAGSVVALLALLVLWNAASYAASLRILEKREY